MTTQPITAELRRWIVAQATAGHSPEVVLDAMKASGWAEEVALSALETTLQDHLRLAGEGAGAGPELAGPARPVPGAQLSASRPVHPAGDRDVSVLLALARPRVVVLGDLLAPDECHALVALAQSRLERSETVDEADGDSEINAARTSEGMFFVRGENALVERIEARIAALLDWPVDHGEGLQILRYGPGAEYKPHYDYFDPAEPGTPTILKRGGQRVGSLVCYLNTPEAGGATVFPDAGLEVAPVCGNAVFFSYERPDPATRTLHGGAPVTSGEKWVATKWMRERRFE